MEKGKLATCIDNTYQTDTLTVGKEYMILDIDVSIDDPEEDDVIIVDNKGETNRYFASRFIQK